MQKVAQKLAIIFLAAPICLYADLPVEREVKVTEFPLTKNELFLFGFPTVKLGDRQARVLTGPAGMRINSNQEIFYTCNGSDFSGFGKDANNTKMYLSMDVPKIPAQAGVSTIQADGQNLDVKLTHFDSYSRVDVKLDHKYFRTPSYMRKDWGGGRNSGNYPGYATEWPFASRTVTELVKKLAPQNSGSYMPGYYVVTYAKGEPPIAQIDPQKDISLQYDYGLQIVVPLKYKKEIEGCETKMFTQKFGNAHLTIAAVAPKRSPFSSALTRATVGAFGIRVYAGREFVRATSLPHMTEAKQGQRFVLSFAVPGQLPANAGTQTIHADNQNIELKILHKDNSCYVLASMPATYWRTPQWLNANWWGGNRNPGGYPDYANDVPFCSRTVKAIVNSLAAQNPNDYYPASYTVSYLKTFDLAGADPTTDASLQGDFIGHVVVPSLHSAVETAANGSIRWARNGRLQQSAGPAINADLCWYALNGRKIAALQDFNKRQPAFHYPLSALRASSGIYLWKALQK